MQEQYPNDTDLLSRTSIIDRSNGRRVRMAWLAVVVSHKGQRGVRAAFPTDGGVTVCRIHKNVPNARFINVTNGVTPRRWLALANIPLLSKGALDEHIGRTWRFDLSQLDELKQHIDYPMVNQAVRQAKFENKQRLASYIAQQLNVTINPKKALFDNADQTYPMAIQAAANECAARHHPL
ncbi:glycogen/starch/alpha-glucan phosphorylase [Klebsiella pneumoniae]|nr:glycogen/starch/alpha-glucan phosphorylase [Klebsiella pneumoniae]